MIEALRSLEEVKYRDHFDRVQEDMELNPSRVDLNLNIVLADFPGVVDWIDEFRAPLSECEGLYPPVPEFGLHVTGLLLVPYNEVTEEERGKFIEIFAERLASIKEKPVLIFGRPEAMDDGVISELLNTEALQEIFGLAANVAEEAFGDKFSRPQTPPGSKAHITLAYGKARTEAEQRAIQQAIDSVDCPDNCEFQVSHVSLTEQEAKADEGCYDQSSGRKRDFELAS